MEDESLKPLTTSQQPCPGTVTIRRNPHRRARPTPKTAVASTSKPPLPVSSFPLQDILSIELPSKAPELLQTPAEDPKSENLKVYLRIRPFDFAESPNATVGKEALAKNGAKRRGPRYVSQKLSVPLKKNGGRICITACSASSVILSPPEDLQEAKRIKAEVFEGFSHVFHPDSSQNDVYEKMVKPLVGDFLRGTSGMLAALGPSGSGKTHTVFGNPREPGIVPLALQHIFGQTNGNTRNSDRSFFLSMFQICTERGKTEKVFDLSNGVELSMHQSAIKGLQEVVITDVGQAQSLIESGMLRRATAMTNSNSQSSRSQCIINICDGGLRHGREADVPATLTFVDLAGAEREKKTGNQGERLLESNFINNTSMVFSLCLRSLLEHQKNPKAPLQKHFQNSLLTRYLRDYLEGKKRMALILTVKPGGDDYVDSAQLLRQAAPLTKIKFIAAEVRNKRQITAVSRNEHAKRAKISRTDASVTEEEKSDSGKAAKAAMAVDPKKLEQPVLHLGRAMWNVLNQYKQKLKAAGTEIESLQENLANKQTKISELEKELHILKASCSCINKDIAEVPSDRRNLYSEFDVAASPEVNEPCSSEASNEVEGKVHSGLLPTPKCNRIQNQWDSTFQQNEDFKHVTDIDCVHAQCLQDLHPHTLERGHLVSTEAESVNVAPSGSSPNFFDAEAEEKYDTAVKKPALEFRNSSEPPDKSLNDQDEQQLNDLKREEFGGNEGFRGDIGDNKVDDFCIIENSKGNSSQPYSLVRKESCSTVELDDLLTDGDEAPENQPAEASEAISSTQVSSSSEPEETLKPELSSKPPSPEKKPRRRLLPVSSVLLKDMSYWNIDDETENPKGHKGRKKKDDTDELRTKGSEALLRLLKGNLI